MRRNVITSLVTSVCVTLICWAINSCMRGVVMMTDVFGCSVNLGISQVQKTTHWIGGGVISFRGHLFSINTTFQHSLCITSKYSNIRKIYNHAMLGAFANTELKLCSAPLYLTPNGWWCCSVTAKAVWKRGGRHCMKVAFFFLAVALFCLICTF